MWLRVCNPCGRSQTARPEYWNNGFSPGLFTKLNHEDTKAQGEKHDYWLKEYSLGALFKSGELEGME
jgi:hypothetical protein